MQRTRILATALALSLGLGTGLAQARGGHGGGHGGHWGHWGLGLAIGLPLIYGLNRSTVVVQQAPSVIYTEPAPVVPAAPAVPPTPPEPHRLPQRRAEPGADGSRPAGLPPLGDHAARRPGRRQRFPPRHAGLPGRPRLHRALTLPAPESPVSASVRPCGGSTRHSQDLTR